MKKKNIYIAGLDLGGTNIRLGIFSASKKPVKIYRKPVGSHKNISVIIELISSMLELAEGELDIKISALDAGIPGIVNSHKGIVYSSPHYPEWENVSFASKLRHKIKIPVRIDNDANRIAMNEAERGAGKKLKSFIMLTLGTGVGGGLVIDKKIFHGDCGFAGEVGHMVIEAEGNPCGCGGQGCLETYVSHSALKRIIREQIRLKKISPNFFKHPEANWGQVAATLARKGQAPFRKIFATMGTCLGIGIASLANITGIFNFVIGGGLSQALDLMLPAMKAEMKKRTYKQTARLIRIHRAQLESL